MNARNNPWVPYVLTRAEGTEGFPALLRELMWRANFSNEPEYFVYTSRIGPYHAESMAKVFLHPRIVQGALERAHTYTGTGSCMDAAIQSCAYNAIAGLRRRYSEINESYTFAYFPTCITRNENYVLYPHVNQESDTGSDRMSELIRAQDVAVHCLSSELDETRRCLGDLTGVLENL